MALVTYPLNDGKYAAEDAELFHCSRCSGIYANADFPCTVTGADNIVTVGIGLAWIRNSRFSGKVAALKEPVAKDLGVADSTYPRIDVIALRFDANANDTDVVVKHGTAASSPVMPAITQAEVVYELYLYAVRREAGAVSVTAADITDLRLDPNYCGLMADSVSRIDLDAIYAQLQSVIREMHDQTEIAKQTIVGAQMEQLWENSEPSAVFRAQEVPLDKDVNDYYMYVAGFYGPDGSTVAANAIRNALEFFLIPNNYPGSNRWMTVRTRGYAVEAVRSVRIRTDTNSIEFGEGRHGISSWKSGVLGNQIITTYQSNDNSMVPVVIYGIKGTPGDGTGGGSGVGITDITIEEVTQ